MPHLPARFHPDPGQSGQVWLSVSSRALWGLLKINTSDRLCSLYQDFNTLLLGIVIHCAASFRMNHTAKDGMFLDPKNMQMVAPLDDRAGRSGDMLYSLAGKEWTALWIARERSSRMKAERLSSRDVIQNPA